ncbi:hypothetical protein IKJ53_01795 [bacterium]|nr:hypothetical protein [bacterium]
MSSGDFKEITIKINNKDAGTVHLQKGCSFENNGCIYRVDDDNNLSVFDKEKQTWSTGESIKMTKYQLDIFKAVANNNEENGFAKDDIVLSEKDIDKAMKLYEEGKLTADLSDGLRTTYKATEVTRYKWYDAFSTYVTNGKENESGRLVFKYGSEWGAEKISELANGQPKVEKSSETKETKKTKEKKDTNFKITNGDPIENIPPMYTQQINKVARQMGISTEKVNAYIRQLAKNTNHSEYFIAHIVSTEEYLGTGKNLGDGTITAGFGRTRYRDKSITEGMQVSPAQAFDWLQKDILFFEEKVKGITLNSDKETIGDHWDEIPLSLREGLIDVAFNRNVGKLEDADEYKSFRTNFLLGEEYLPACAVRLRQDFSKYSYNQKLKHKFTTGLMKRNCYRFLLSIQSFDAEQKASAKRRFDGGNNQYYTETIKLLKAKGYSEEAEMLQKAWDNI